MESAEPSEPDTAVLGTEAGLEKEAGHRTHEQGRTAPHFWIVGPPISTSA